MFIINYLLVEISHFLSLSSLFAVTEWILLWVLLVPLFASRQELKTEVEKKKNSSPTLAENNSLIN
jgi:hypothetical protein